MAHTDINRIITYAPPGSDAVGDLLNSVGQRYDTTPRPSETELIMDGAFYMIMKSRSPAFLTRLRLPLPKPGEFSSHQSSDQFKFQACRRCSGKFTFRLRSGGFVTILPAVPAKGTDYKAMSYVWGDVRPLELPCERCGQVTSIPMMNARRFENLMELGGSGSSIWLDAISIDQSNHSEVAATITDMGTIYSNARCVSVLLPESDFPIFECLNEAAKNAMAILTYAQNFVSNSEMEVDDPTGAQPGKIRFLSVCSQLFLENILQVIKNFHHFTYWRRAWTFQEWALAKDLEIAVEGGPAEICFGVKSLMLGAGILLARYKMLLAQYAEINTGLSRSNAPAIFKRIKDHFPYEDLFLSYEEIDPKEASFQTNFPHFGVNQLFGLRNLPPGASLEPRPDEQSRLRARLILLLSSFASSHHEAKYEADLVACWAGMCNLQYDYRKDDDFQTALQKALVALRARGVTVYQFLPDTRGGIHKPWDSFRDYAREHIQVHCMTPGPYPGPPIFTGQADISIHMAHSVLKVALPTQFIRSIDGLIRIVDASVSDIIPLDDIDDAMSKFAKTVYGYLFEGPILLAMFHPAQAVAEKSLKKIESEQRAIAKLCIVRVPFRATSDDLELFLWAVIPADIPRDEIFIAREPTNGTLVLATWRNGNSYIVAYLTLTDHLSGTFLVKTDGGGHIHLCLKIPERGGTSHSGYMKMGDRHLRGMVPLEPCPGAG